MKRVAIEFPSTAFSVELPADAVETLALFYPRSVRRGDADDGPPDFTIRENRRQWALQRHEESIGLFSDPIYALLALEFEIENAVVKATGDAIALHAGCVATASGAWLIAGHPDTGKTSSTFHLLELGQSFLCEEIALYEPATRRVLPYLQTLSIEREFLAEYQESFHVESGELVALDTHITRFIPRRMAESPAVLDAVLLPRYRPGERPFLEVLEADSVLAEFLGYCFPPEDGEETVYDAAIDLLETARLYRFTYGSAGQARALLCELLDPSTSSS